MNEKEKEEKKEKRTLHDFIQIEEEEDFLLEKKKLSDIEEENSLEDTMEDKAFTSRRKIAPTSIIFIICLIIVAGGIIFIISNEELRDRLFAFFTGEIIKQKKAEKEAFLKKMREIETLTANRYGTINLTYSPKDARVDIIEFKYTQPVEEYVKRIKLGGDLKASAVTREIDNPSLHLEKGKLIQQIPLQNIPILETSEDSKNVHIYEYEIKISKEGYETRRFYLQPLESHRIVEGAQVLVWKEMGPAIFLVDFAGCDLIPKPETAKENFKKAWTEIHCFRKFLEKEKKKWSEDDIKGMENEIQVRYGFKTATEFNYLSSQLKDDVEWWSETQKEIQKVKCAQYKFE